METLNTWQRVLSSSFIMASSMGLAVVLHDVTTVWGFLGSSAAVTLTLTLTLTTVWGFLGSSAALSSPEPSP